MHAVVNRIPLREPLRADELERAQRDLDAAAGGIEGLLAVHVLAVGDDELIVLVFGEDEDALDRTREQLGNAFIREHVIPHAAGPPERTVGKAVLTYRRPR